MPRLFIGIGLPNAYQDRLPSFTNGLKDGLATKVRWSKPGNWHLTLKFLGETDEALIPDISTALNSIEAPPFTLKAGGVGVFPRVQYPRVIWVGLKQGADECAALAGQVENSLADLGIAREKKQFRPHLTVGRINKPQRDDWNALLEKAGKYAWPAFSVDRFTLWKSELKPAGAVHTVSGEFLLS